MLRKMHLVTFFIACTCMVLSARADPPTPFIRAWDEFRRQWNDNAWQPRGGRFSKYIRPLEDTGWIARMRAMHAVAEAGEPAVDFLISKLKTGTTAERILAAQALAYVPAAHVRDAVLRAAREDADPAVRLHAVDTFGRLGGQLSDEELAGISGRESNPDVRRHWAYLPERGGQRLIPPPQRGQPAVPSLRDWNLKQLNTARLGAEAPDFELTSLQGETIRLRDFRGKSPVVLVFLYGDT